MRLRNDELGYGAVTKLLHWLTVVVVVAQFVVGWTMSDDDSAFDRADERLDRLEERYEQQAEREGEAAEERYEREIERLEDELDAREDEARPDGFGLHVGLGLTLLALALVRLLWRRTTPLPPWAAHLGPGERRLESWLEKLLLTMLLVVPATGLSLVLGSSDWLPVHVAAQIGLLALIAVHVGLVLKHTVVRRNRHLSRML